MTSGLRLQGVEDVTREYTRVAAEGATWLVKKGELLDPSLAALRS